MNCKLERSGLGYKATIPTIPGVGSYGPTQDEAVLALRRNLVLMFEFNPQSIPLICELV